MIDIVPAYPRQGLCNLRIITDEDEAVCCTSWRLTGGENRCDLLVCCCDVSTGHSGKHEVNSYVVARKVDLVGYTGIHTVILLWSVVNELDYFIQV